MFSLKAEAQAGLSARSVKQWMWQTRQCGTPHAPSDMSGACCARSAACAWAAGLTAAARVPSEARLASESACTPLTSPPRAWR